MSTPSTEVPPGDASSRPQTRRELSLAGTAAGAVAIVAVFGVLALVLHTNGTKVGCQPSVSHQPNARFDSARLSTDEPMIHGHTPLPYEIGMPAQRLRRVPAHQAIAAPASRPSDASHEA